MNNRFLESLKATIEKTERYVLLALSGALVFVVLSLPEAQRAGPGGMVKWQLLGFPLEFQPPIALVALYLLYCFSCLLADNMLLHVRDLVAKLEAEASADAEAVAKLQAEIRATLTHPTVLTVSPIGQFVVTVVPSVLICAGLAKSHSSGVYELPWFVWAFAYGFGALMGIGVYARVRQFIAPHLG